MSGDSLLSYHENIGIASHSDRSFCELYKVMMMLIHFVMFFESCLIINYSCIDLEILEQAS